MVSSKYSKVIFALYYKHQIFAKFKLLILHITAVKHKAFFRHEFLPDQLIMKSEHRADIHFLSLNTFTFC